MGAGSSKTWSRIPKVFSVPSLTRLALVSQWAEAFGNSPNYESSLLDRVRVAHLGQVGDCLAR